MRHPLKHLKTLLAVGSLSIAVACGTPVEKASPKSEPLLGTAGGPSTSREDLDRIVVTSRAALAAKPGDIKGAVRLADALLRQTRVTGNAGLAGEAETVLQKALAFDATNYDALRMLAAVYASQHRFRDAVRQVDRCLSIRTDDAWVYGVAGDAHLELGDYPQAFDAFDRMNAQRPNAAAYARASYARELQGDLDQSLRYMQMATEATSAQDPESLAWHHAQLGHLYLQMGQLANARREFLHADYAFPGHPFASDGLARVDAAEGNYAAALDIVTERIRTMPAPADLALAGDLLLALGRRDEAEARYRLAEAAWQADMPEPTRLVRFLSERGRHLDQVIALGEKTYQERRDIFTADALAWAYFQTGRLDQAQRAMKDALRTGSHDRVILYHAAAIERAAGHLDTARRLVADALDQSPRFDLIAAPGAEQLRADLGPARVAQR